MEIPLEEKEAHGVVNGLAILWGACPIYFDPGVFRDAYLICIWSGVVVWVSVSSDVCLRWC